jgi:DNA polymerase III alpha subunit (gram-positive type)
MMNYLILDIETDGNGTFRPPTQRPIQISYQLIDEHGNLIHKDTDFIHGVEEILWDACPWTMDFINNNGIPFDDAVNKLRSVITNNTIIVGHNIDFDVGCINYRYGFNIISNKKICTMKSTTSYCKLPPKRFNQYKWPSLAELAKKLNIDIDSSKLHDSIYDVEITKLCFVKLLQNGFVSRL